MLCCWQECGLCSTYIKSVGVSILAVSPIMPGVKAVVKKGLHLSSERRKGGRRSIE